MSESVTEELVQARESIIDGIRRQMLGPGMERQEDEDEEQLAHERLQTSPSLYSCGILYPLESETMPQSDASLASEDDAIEDEAETSVTDKAKLSEEDFSDRLNLANQLRPSSFGITFFADRAVERVRVHVSFGTYAEEADEDGKRFFVRTPHEQEVLLAFGGKNFAQGPDLLKRSESEVGLQAFLTGMRRSMRAGDSQAPMSVTLMLQNTKKKGERIVPTPDECIFQPQIRVSSAENGFRFVSQEQVEETFREGHAVPMDEEESGLALLYREKRTFASGHGVSIDWDIETVADGTASGEVKSEFLPVFEVPAMNYELRPKFIRPEDRELSMKYYSDLADAPQEEKLGKLEALVASYERWIEEQETRCKTLTKQEYCAAGQKNLAACRSAARRMRAGISLLKENEEVRLAFALANRAMFLQRLMGAMQRDLSKKKRYENDEEVREKLQTLDPWTASDADAQWRPFQLAFLLLSLSGIVYDRPEEGKEDRDLVDLIWFPTGGGKTEAYLGLSAFTIFYRRLAHPEDADGTNILMRYTLRMLTGQQFTRAATLVCACELVRQESQNARPARILRKKNVGTASLTGPTYPGRLGDTPITIGLWMGSAHVANRNEDAKRDLAEMKRNKYAENRFQVLHCPWCGTELVPDNRKKGQWGYIADGKSTQFICPQEACAFHDGLPLQIIDEELYREPPTLLIGTIDKFAQVAWKAEVQRFFEGRGPELIIQDELHLIAGPLGSIAGLYEMGLDEIFRANGDDPPRGRSMRGTLRPQGGAVPGTGH